MTGDAGWRQQWVAEKSEPIASVFYNGTVFEVEPHVEVRAGQEYVARPDLGRAGFAVIKRPWVTPTLTEHDDRAIRSGSDSTTEPTPGDPHGT